MRSIHSFARGMAVRGVLAALLTAFLALTFSACGQRGPLYLPDSAPETVAPAEEAPAGSKAEASDTSADTTDDEDRQ